MRFPHLCKLTTALTAARDGAPAEPGGGLSAASCAYTGRQHKAAAPAVSREEQRKRFGRLARRSKAGASAAEVPKRERDGCQCK